MSEEYRVICGHQLLNFKDNDHYHAALKASHVLLQEGRLKKYSSSQGETITVHGISVTQVYRAWKSLCSSGLQIPVIECIRTFINDNWFSNPESSAEFSIVHEMIPETPESLFAQLNIDNNDFIASITSIPNIVNCAEDLLSVMLAIWGFPIF